MKAYYINLARRTDRRASMEAQLSRLGIDAERIEAVTPADISVGDLHRYTGLHNADHVTPPELACNLSHHAALQRFLSTAETHALILEDDVLLSLSVAKVLDAVPADVDVLRLETYLTPQHIWTEPTSHLGIFALHRVDGWCLGSAAYVISRLAAERVLNAASSLGIPYDQMLFNPYRYPGSVLRTLQLVPALAMQADRMTTGNSVSDVRVTQAHRHPKPMLLRPLHAFHRFWQRDLRMGLPKTIHHLTGKTRRGIIPLQQD